MKRNADIGLFTDPSTQISAINETVGGQQYWEKNEWL